jgi:hypothetical protein
MASWTDLSSVFLYGEILTSAQQQQLRDNITAAFEKASGAPVLALNYVTTSSNNESMIDSHAIRTRHLIWGCVNSGQIEGRAVNSYDINEQSVGSYHLGLSAVASGHIAANNVGSAHISSSSIGSAHIKAAQIGSQHLAANIISIGHLYDGSGAVSLRLISSVGNSDPVSANLTLPGGGYGFYPQTKVNSPGGDITYSEVKIAKDISSGTDYRTNIWLALSGTDTTTKELFATQTYITASGKHFWYYTYGEKDTGNIIAQYAGDDHPCYGNGNDPELVQHPFPQFNSDSHFMIVIPIPKKSKFYKKLKADEVIINGFKRRDISKIIMEDYHPEESTSAYWPDDNVVVGFNKHNNDHYYSKINRKSYMKKAVLKKNE